MRTYPRRAALLIGAAAFAFTASPADAQHEGHTPPATGEPEQVHPPHPMWNADLGAGWRLLAMGQAFPIITVSAPGEDDSPFSQTEPYLTQPAVMANLEDGRQRLVLRTTLNFEGLTLPEGELTLGGWGEGFIDKRHPHTLLHELMLSVNFWDIAGGAASLSAGKGFAPYGTDDPMARPGLKYPTNHHLSQILERWTLNGVYRRAGWSFEAGLFGGTEPEGPYDLSNISTFGDSWSARATRRWGAGSGPMAEWEASASFGSVTEEHHGRKEHTGLWNAALRHAGALGSGADRVYGLLEASVSDPEHGDGYFSVLAEARAERGRHQPYARIEYATRPEYEREGAAGTDDFFRYHHGDTPIGATRWLIGTVAYAFQATSYPMSLRPFVEAQYHVVRGERGEVDPATLFRGEAFWALSLGSRIFLGGDPMRMGAYGVLDPMTAMHRMQAGGGPMDTHGGHDQP